MVLIRLLYAPVILVWGIVMMLVCTLLFVAWTVMGQPKLYVG